MNPRENTQLSAHRGAIFLVILMMFSVLPLMAPSVAADGSISLNVSPNSMEVNPGESGEYTVVIFNTGSDPVTVNLQASNEPGEDCNGFTTTISQIPGQIESGSSEETTMNVTLTQTVEPDSACDTTVTATITAVIGAPGAEVPEPSTETVTTTAGDGSGSTLYGVDLYFDNVEERNTQKKVLGAGTDMVTYFITVENTGQENSQQSSIDLAIEEVTGNGCNNPQDLTVTLSDSQVTLEPEETEQITVEVEVPEGQQANDYCWEVTGTVSGSNPAQNATDTVEMELEVPVLKECSMDLSKTTLNLQPDDVGTLTATLSNEGNSDWSVSMSVAGDPGSGNNKWVTFDGPSSGLLPYNSGSGTKSFDIEVQPDDSRSAGSETQITVQAKDGGTLKCIKQFTVVLGQSYGASLNLQTPNIGPIEPGENQSSKVTITNLGNGEDTLRVTVSSPPSGWSITLDKSTVSVGSRHGSSKSADVFFTVSVPEDALATESTDLTFSVLPNGGGQAYQTKILSVTVKETHGMDVERDENQTGRSNTILLFPITVENLGNNEDSFRFYTKRNTENWETWFMDEAGNQQSQFDIGARESQIITLNVRVKVGTENWEFTDIDVEITNLGDSNTADDNLDGLPDNKRLEKFRAIRSDVNYSMDLNFDKNTPGVSIDNRVTSVVLPPEGEVTFDLWVENTGDENYDNAVFDINGLEGLATRQLTLNGEVVDLEDKFKVLSGYGLWNSTTDSYQLDDEGELIHSYSIQGMEMEKENRKMVELEIRPFRLLFQLTLEVNPGAVTGDGGVLEIVVTSESNSADRSGFTSVSLEVQTIYNIQFQSDIELHHNLEYPDKKTINVDVINEGNVRTQFIILNPEGLRGWTVSMDYTNGSCSSNSEGLTCWLDVGESIGLEVNVRPSFDAEVEDNFTFTLSVEPIETGVIDRENIEFSVLGEPYAGAFGLGIQQEHIKSGIFALIAVLFLGVIYQGARPALRDMDMRARAKRELIYVDKISEAKTNGFKTKSAFSLNPVPHRSSIKQWLLFIPLTLGLYPVFILYQWGHELKVHANLGPGGGKNLLFFLIPLFNIYWAFKFIGMVRLLETQTMHQTKISGKAPLVWFILSILVFPVLTAVTFIVGALVMIPIIILLPAIISTPILYLFYAFVTWLFLLPTYKIWSMTQNSLNTSWTIWFGKSA
ncbi:MAG: hypothetical protein HON16_00230 [Euryarchaeota archaeon]|jgi:uncharacterized membrane protein|nr:hypothetical protein [Euryarchaeota archaeon]